MFKIKEKATNFTTTVKDSIKNAKMNIKTMVRQVKCIKNKIVKWVFQKKLTKGHTYNNYNNYKHTKINQKHRNLQFLKFKNLKLKLSFNAQLLSTCHLFHFATLISSLLHYFIFILLSFFVFSIITNKFNISGINQKLLKLVHLDDCFEVKEEKYGFRSKVTLVENSPCILGLTCRGQPEPGSDPGTMTTVSSSIQNKVDEDDLIHNYLDHLERQSGEEFSSEGPPECRVVRASQCNLNS